MRGATSNPVGPGPVVTDRDCRAEGLWHSFRPTS